MILCGKLKAKRNTVVNNVGKLPLTVKIYIYSLWKGYMDKIKVLDNRT